MRYKQTDKSLPQIAQELGVQGVVEGSIFRAGDRVRITLQLIDARNDLHLWAQTYERDLRDVLALQSEVARAVAEQIRLKLTPEEQAALTAYRTVDPRAYDAYLRGFELRGPSSLVTAWGSRAIAQFERAVELDSNFAEGWAWLARTRVVLGLLAFDLRFRGEFAKAREAAERALEIDDRLGKAHAALGSVQLWYEWDFAGARREYDRALQLSPSDPEILNAYAFVLTWTEGKAQEALSLSDRVLRVAPFDRLYRADRVRIFFHLRQYQRALDEVERVRELYPDLADNDISSTYLMLGRLGDEHRERIAYFKRCGASCDWMLEAREQGWAEGGWERSVRAWLEAATHREGFPPWRIAAFYASIGETDEAFAWLERGYRERDPLMIVTKFHPLLDPLHSDPRFDDLVRRIGFPED
jgi:tetratricopeptide (TPR) repeat protein